MEKWGRVFYSKGSDVCARPNTSKRGYYWILQFFVIDKSIYGTYRFKTGFYGLTTLPAELQRVMDAILSEFPCELAFTDDLPVISKGSKNEHIALVEKILKKLDKESMAPKLEKCKVAMKECEWLGQRTTNSSMTSLVRKTNPIDKLDPLNRCHFKYFMSSIHSLHKHLQALAECSAPLRPLLRKKYDFAWTSKCRLAF